MSVSFRAAQAKNKRKTFLLLFCMFVFVVLAIWAVSQLVGYGSVWVVPIAVALALAGVWASYWSSDKIVMKMTNAKVIDHATAPQLFNVVDEVRIAAGLPMPTVAIVDDPAPNAFATGRNPEHAVIAFTTGLLATMDREQLQGVTAHEMAHVGNRDTLVMAVAATTAGLIAIIADIGIRMSFFTRRDNNNPIAAIAGIVLLSTAGQVASTTPDSSSLPIPRIVLFSSLLPVVDVGRREVERDFFHVELGEIEGEFLSEVGEIPELAHRGPGLEEADRPL